MFSGALSVRRNKSPISNTPFSLRGMRLNEPSVLNPLAHFAMSVLTNVFAISTAVPSTFTDFAPLKK